MRNIRDMKGYIRVSSRCGFEIYTNHLDHAVVLRDGLVVKGIRYDASVWPHDEELAVRYLESCIGNGHIIEGIGGVAVSENVEFCSISDVLLYRQKKDAYIREYGEWGYITSTGVFNDRIVNESGRVFLSGISRKARSLSDIVDSIMPVFIDADRNLLLKDGREFYDELVEDGFLVSGFSEDEIAVGDHGFSYDDIAPKTVKNDFSPLVSRADGNTQLMLEKYFGGEPHLTSFQIELTSRCNERCVHCYIPHENKHDDITPELYYSVLGQLSKMGVLSVTLSGGEPMLHPNFVDFLRAAKEYDFYVNILSNLTLLNDDTLAAMKEINVSSVQVSLYSMKPHIHDSITTIPGSFDKTMNAILRLIENNIPLQISCPTMKGNKDEFGDVMIWAKEHKVRAVTDYMIMAEYNHDTSNLAHRLSPEEAGDVIRDVLLTDEEYQRAILSPGFEAEKDSLLCNPERQLCGVGISSCCMVSNGNVYPCAGWQGYVIGNLYEDTLENIWNKSPKINYLRGLKLKDLGHGECCNCKDSAFCAPCMVRNANESKTGDPLEINRHFCEVASVNRRIVEEWRKAKNAL